MKFSTEFGHSVPISTVKSICDAYHREIAHQVDPSLVKTVKKGQRGQPLLLGPVLDQCVRDYLEAIRLTGSILSHKIVLMSALGIVKSRQPSLLPRHGDLQLKNSWAESILRRANFVKRKGTKAANPGSSTMKL